MAKQDVDFRHGGPLTGDDGERGNNTPGIASIKPYDDGERAVAASFGRPVENLRQRTEVLRTLAGEQAYLNDAGMRWIIGSGKDDGLHDPGTPWPVIENWKEHPANPGYWYFSLLAGTAVVVQPLNTPSEDLQEVKQWEFPTGAATGWIDVTMNLRAYSLANIREIIWQELPTADIIGTHGTPGVCDLEVSGEGGHILTITLEDSGATTLGHLNAAFLAYGATLLSSGFVCAVSGDPLTVVTLADIPVGEVDYIFSGTFERELHYIPAATFDNFFTASLPDNLLLDGDTLAVVWGSLVEDFPSVDGRRQAIPGNANTEVLVGQLFKTSDHPEWIPIAIPLCKRIKNELVWLDGTIATEGHIPAANLRIGENGYTVNRIYNGATTIPISMTSKWYAALVAPTWVTIQTALDGLVADLADVTSGAGGASRIGVSETSETAASLVSYNVPAPGEALHTVLATILRILNDKGSLNAGALFGAEETVTGRWAFSNHVRQGEDIAVLRDAFSSALYTLVYRNDGKDELLDSIDWSTCSIYEATNPGVYGKRVIVFGGYMTALATIITPGSSSGSVSVFFEHTNQWFYRYSVDASAGAQTLSLLDPTDWDFSEALSLVGQDLTRTISGNTFSAGVTYNTYISWDIAQQLRNDYDMIEGRARIQLVSQPYSGVLEGMYLLPEDLNDTLGTWTHNTIHISPGRVLINGTPYMQATEDHIHPTSLLLPTVVIAADEASLTPGWLYLWARKDIGGATFTYRIGQDKPQSDWVGAGPGSALYRIDPAEVEGGYSVTDYTLVDVLSVMAHIPLGYYYDCAPPIGGTERRFLSRTDPLGAGGIKYGFLITSVAYSATTDFMAIGSTASGDTAIKSPGIPLGVTSSAELLYAITASVIDGETVIFRVGLNNSSAASDNGFYPSSDYTAAPSAFRRTITPTAGDLSLVDDGRLSVIARNNQVWSLLSIGAGSSASVRLELIGFHWDRKAGPQGISM